MSTPLLPKTGLLFSDCTNADVTCSLVNASNLLYLLYSFTITQFVHTVQFTPAVYSIALGRSTTFCALGKWQQTWQRGNFLRGSFCLLNEHDRLHIARYNILTFNKMFPTNTFVSIIQVKTAVRLKIMLNIWIVSEDYNWFARVMVSQRTRPHSNGYFWILCHPD